MGASARGGAGRLRALTVAFGVICTLSIPGSGGGAARLSSGALSSKWRSAYGDQHDNKGHMGTRRVILYRVGDDILY
jgi:hypothetical protein